MLKEILNRLKHQDQPESKKQVEESFSQVTSKWFSEIQKQRAQEEDNKISSDKVREIERQEAAAKRQLALEQASIVEPIIVEVMQDLSIAVASRCTAVKDEGRFWPTWEIIGSTGGHLRIELRIGQDYSPCFVASAYKPKDINDGKREYVYRSKATDQMTNNGLAEMLNKIIKP